MSNEYNKDKTGADGGRLAARTDREDVYISLITADLGSLSLSHFSNLSCSNPRVDRIISAQLAKSSQYSRPFYLSALNCDVPILPITQISIIASKCWQNIDVIIIFILVPWQ